MTAAADFKGFRTACLHWQTRFGLFDWQLIFQHEPRPVSSEDGMATVFCDWEARVSKLVYRHRGIRGLSISEIAKHEMLHILLNDYAKMVAIRADDMHTDALREEHKLVERLMRVVA